MLKRPMFAQILSNNLCRSYIGETDYHRYVHSPAQHTACNPTMQLHDDDCINERTGIRFGNRKDCLRVTISQLIRTGL
jgi:1,6-anhydro-N-acetylmuramate kinase